MNKREYVNSLDGSKFEIEVTSENREHIKLDDMYDSIKQVVTSMQELTKVIKEFNETFKKTT